MLYYKLRMSNTLTVRLDSKRAAALRAHLKRTGLSKTEVVRAGLDRVLSNTGDGLPAAALRLCGSVDGPARPATNVEVRKAMRK